DCFFLCFRVLIHSNDCYFCIFIDVFIKDGSISSSLSFLYVISFSFNSCWTVPPVVQYVFSSPPLSTVTWNAFVTSKCIPSLILSSSLKEISSCFENERLCSAKNSSTVFSVVWYSLSWPSTVTNTCFAFL